MRLDILFLIVSIGLASAFQQQRPTATTPWRLPLKLWTETPVPKGKVSSETPSDDEKQNGILASAPAEAQPDEAIIIGTPPSLKFRSAGYELSCAALVGILTGCSVAAFKLSIDAIRRLSYSFPVFVTYPWLVALIPAAGGLIVGGILLLGSLPPGLKGTVTIVDENSKNFNRNWGTRLKIQAESIRKSAAAVFTLGTGSSLGPEGPCVEIGMNVARTCMDLAVRSTVEKRRRWNRILLCCGAAAGVAAGFDAPVAGVFFALEVMQTAYLDVNEEQRKSKMNNILSADGLFSSTSSITPVLLSAVLSALCARSLLGQHLVFQVSNYSLPNPLIELPMYLLLGSVSGCVAFLFSEAAKASRSFFSGELGGTTIQNAMKKIPDKFKPALGGLFCGVVALAYPQILFFGYETLNPLLSNASVMPTSLLLVILLVKSIATAVAAGSGLVGGTFAPALFLGAMTGASFQQIMASLYKLADSTLISAGITGMPTVMLADLPAYAMVGSATVLAALFRAPLTASLLLFELSRDYDVILPLIASAGLGSVVGDILDDKFERVKERRRDQDSTSWGDLSK